MCSCVFILALIQTFCTNIVDQRIPEQTADSINCITPTAYNNVPAVLTRSLISDVTWIYLLSLMIYFRLLGLKSCSLTMILCLLGRLRSEWLDVNLIYILHKSRLLETGVDRGS